MSMNGNWLRVTPGELDHARTDLAGAYDMAITAQETESERWCGTDKAWHALDFLLDRFGVDVPVVMGAESFVAPAGSPATVDNGEDHWGYDRPRYLTPAQVVSAAAQLARLTEDDLVRGVDVQELSRAEVYPGGWEQHSDAEWPTHYLPDARRFFAAAARDGDAVICWID